MICILVNEQEIENEDSNPIYFKTMNFVCPSCGENAKVNLTEYKIFSHYMKVKLNKKLIFQR